MGEGNTVPVGTQLTLKALCPSPTLPFLIYCCPVGEEVRLYLNTQPFTAAGNCPPLPSVTVWCTSPLSEVPSS